MAAVDKLSGNWHVSWKCNVTMTCASSYNRFTRHIMLILTICGHIVKITLCPWFYIYFYKNKKKQKLKISLNCTCSLLDTHRISKLWMNEWMNKWEAFAGWGTIKTGRHQGRKDYSKDGQNVYKKNTHEEFRWLAGKLCIKTWPTPIQVLEPLNETL